MTKKCEIMKKKKKKKTKHTQNASKKNLFFIAEKVIPKKVKRNIKKQNIAK